MNLTEFKKVLWEKKSIEISSEELQKVEESYRFLKVFSKDKVIYGINTGFGPMASYHIEEADLINLQYNIIRSHSCGAGEPLPSLWVKAALIARLRAFLTGCSGVHPQTVELLRQFINCQIIPFVPRHGSVGASGDLVQLAHIALVLIGEGNAFYQNTLQSSAKIMEQLRISPLSLHIREGLALTNGTSMMTGIGLVNLVMAQKLLNYAVIASVLMNEIASSPDDFMSERLNELKSHRGQIEIAAQMRTLAQKSRCLTNRQEDFYTADIHQKILPKRVQPYYSLRCAPQILGPVNEVLHTAEQILIEELNSANDNPIVDPQTQMVYHGGNFHGDYISLEMDKIKIAITKMTMLMERQLNYLCHDKINGILPPFVNLGTPGLNYGMQALQFTATSTTAECQTLSNPMYIHSIPNNNDNQDIVSMGTNSALLTAQVIENAWQVLSIHLIALAQAIDYLKISQNLAPATRQLYERIRSLCPQFSADEPKYLEIQALIESLKSE